MCCGMGSGIRMSKSGMAYRKPAYGLSPGAGGPLRRQPGDPHPPVSIRGRLEKSLDLWLFLNGIPTATAELKNPITGQSVEDAIPQYRKDRDPGNVTLRDGRSFTSPWTPIGWP